MFPVADFSHFGYVIVNEIPYPNGTVYVKVTIFRVQPFDAYTTTSSDQNSQSPS